MLKLNFVSIKYVNNKLTTGDECPYTQVNDI